MILMNNRREHTNAIVLWPDEWFEPGSFVATGFRWYVMPSSIPCHADPATAKPALDRDVLRNGAGDCLTSRYSPDLARVIRNQGFTGPIYRVTLIRVQGHFSITLLDD